MNPPFICELLERKITLGVEQYYRLRVVYCSHIICHLSVHAPRGTSVYSAVMFSHRRLSSAALLHSTRPRSISTLAPLRSMISSVFLVIYTFPSVNMLLSPHRRHTGIFSFCLAQVALFMTSMAQPIQTGSL